MSRSTQLSRPFFEVDAVLVARNLLGMRLVRMENNNRMSGFIIETEAYRGEEDLACHARSGRTPRTQVMYGEPGHAYVYFTYGMHWMLNFVAGSEGFPAAVLIRSILPVEGIELIRMRRNKQPREHWTDGPAKICQALNIDSSFHGVDVCSPNSELFVETGLALADSQVYESARIGLNNVPEPWKSIPWRFLVSPETIAHNQ